jgi:hypothetical protein
MIDERTRIAREIDERPYLYAHDPQSGRWSVNAKGTVLTPVWDFCSGLEHELLEARRLGTK